MNTMVTEKLQLRARLLYKRAYQLLRPYSVGGRGVLFVAGNQRSGTNMLMDVLERSLETDVFHEKDPRAFIDYQMRELPIIHTLHSKSRAPLFVIKALCELQDLSSLLEEFKPAKLVWITRHHHDVVNSMMRSFDGFSAQLQSIAADRNSSSWRGRGMSDHTHQLVEHYAAKNVNDETAAALQWYYRNVLFFEQGFDTSADALLVHYENLVTQPVLEFQRIFDFLDLNFTPSISAKVFASSVNRNKPPEIEPEVESLCLSLHDRFKAIAS
jgi:Sulfotransferase family